MTSSYISVTLDKDANAAYITLSQETVVETVALNSEVNVDLDLNGVAVGIETLSIDARLPFERLCKEFHVHSTVVDLLRLIGPNVGTFVTSAPAGTSPARADHIDRTDRTERGLTHA